ncbi:MAG: gliding motility-associated C-terminal domain-containing protein, partial [Elusimicrobia bacterium]|nr:gliding motility-associated C-terminal domain-containing protein [Elusimicrobiota bacterium]
GLTGNTTHSISVDAKNSNGIITNYSQLTTTCTLAEPPINLIHLSNSTTGFIWAWTTNNPSGTEFYASDDNPDNSGWAKDLSQWQTTIVHSTNTQYTLYVKARNHNGFETVEVSTKAYTSIQKPEGIEFGTINASTINVRYTGMFDNLSAGDSGVKYVNITGGTTSSWLINNSWEPFIDLSANTQYSFYARARNGDGDETEWSDVFSTYTYIEPAPDVEFNVYVTSIDARPIGTFSNITSGDSGIKTWNVTESTDSGWRQNTDWWLGPNNLIPNTTYFFKADSKNFYNITSGETQLIGTSTLAELPLTPSLNSAYSSSMTIKINTGSNPPWTEYSIKVTSGAVDQYVDAVNQLAGSPVYRTTMTWTDNIWITGLTPDTTHIISVDAKNSNGVTTEYSQLTTTSTLANPPTGTDFIGVYAFSVILSWDNNNNPSGTRYEISQSTDNFEFNFSTPVPLSANLTSLTTTIYNLDIDTTYYYRVCAVNNNDIYTVFDDVVSTCTKLAIPFVPTGFEGESVSQTSICWSWTDNATNEDGYRIFTSTDGLLYDSFTDDTTYWIENELTPNTSYARYVQAYNFYGTVDSSSDTCYTTANLPTDLICVDKTTATAILSWNGNGATRYAVERATDVGGSPYTWSYIAEWNDYVVTAVYKDENLTFDTTYWYRVRGYNGDMIITSPSNQIPVKTEDETPPSSVTSLAAYLGGTEEVINLKWSASGDNGINGVISSGYYEVKWSTNSADRWDSINSVSWSTSTVIPGDSQYKAITGLIKGTTYYFWVKTADEVLNWSDISNTATNFAQLDYIKPSPITDLAAYTGYNEGEIKLLWTATGDNGLSGEIITGKYHIKYTDDPVHTWNDAPYEIQWSTDTLPDNIESKIINGLTGGTTYYFWIKIADESDNYSDLSNKTTAWAQIDIAPPASVSLSINTVTDTSVELNWIAPGDDGPPEAGGQAYQYDIRYSTTGPIDTDTKFNSATQVSNESVPKPAGTNETFMVAGLTEQTVYYFALKTGDELLNWSGLSNSPQAETLPTERIIPLEPAGIKGILSEDRKYITITWSAVTKNENLSACDDLNGYNIYRGTVLDGAYSLRGFVSRKAALSWTESEDITGTRYYYKIRAVDINGNESKDSLVVDTTSDLNIIALADDGKTSMIIPKEVRNMLYKGSNPYNNDIRIVIVRKQEEEIGKVICSYEFKALKADNNEEIKNFTIPSNKPKVKIALSYDEKVVKQSLSRLNLSADLSGADARKWLGIFWFNGVEWIKLGGQVNEDSQTFEIKSSRLGKYKIQQVLRATEFELIQVWPRKTFTPNGDGINDEINFVFENPKESVVYGCIYDITGAFVADLNWGGDNSSLKWDGKERNGNVVREGVYIYQIKSEGKIINGTVVLVK